MRKRKNDEGYRWMTHSTEDEIRRRAYELWKAAGRPDGRSDAFWNQAEIDLLKKDAEQDEVPPGLTDNLPI